MANTDRKYRGPLFTVLKISFVTILCSFLVVSMLTSGEVKKHIYSPTLQSISTILPENVYLLLMQQEIRSLRALSSEDKVKMDWMEIATNVKVGDFRSLLGREIPGLERYHTEIIIAGEGTDISNLPRESPPPSEGQLRDHEIVQEELDKAHEENPHKETEDVEDKVVYIYHSHSWEAFKPLIKSNDSTDASSTNEEVNVIAVGEKLMNELESRGIGVSHNQLDVTKGLKEKDWNYTHSYEYSRELVQEAIAQNDKLTYLIDIHRDSQPGEVTTKTINGTNYARLFFVVGKENKNYEKNLEIATKLHNDLERSYPGLSRGVFVKTKAEGNGVYNQDLTERALLLEFGGVDNNMTELYNSVDAFAEVFESYYRGDAEKVNAD
ncbi:stage II sporulation protein P [Halobacillus salinus]|uniref:Stage II sporulation protein P n=1 Tax=Halobacillus salinus TaxID=192814 RepID=A0A4Z0GV45_9BACI|nr:stage II sporulation protein P [Halobacillus salinus]TGB01078.1 stage II sporulation protein P [Halobacillus salinus]